MIAVASLAVGAGCARARPPAGPPPWGVVMGDSVAFGIGANAPGSNPAACLGRLTGHAFANEAVPGSNSRTWLTRADEVAAQRPKLIFVSLGGNDLQMSIYGKIKTANPWHERFSAEETLANMKDILRKLKGSGAEVIYLGIVPPRTILRPHTFLLDDRLSQLQTTVAPAAGVLVIPDAFDGLWLDSNYMADDIHPNDRGYDELCTRVRTAMRANPRFEKFLR